MNFTLRLIITITMLSKILGAFNAVFSYTGISLRSLVKKVGIIYYHLAYTMHKPPLLMSVYACLSVQYVNPCVEWTRGGSTLSVGAGMWECVINLYKRGSIVSTTLLSDLSWNHWMLCLLLSLFRLTKMSLSFFFFQFGQTVLFQLFEQETMR